MPTSALPLKRLSRPAAPPGYRLMERDVTILQAAARFRFVSSDQVIRHLGDASQQVVLRRLRVLYCNRLLDRPVHQHAQLAAFFDYGNRPLVYALARRGAQILAELGMPIDHRLDWTTKNARATSYFLAHTLEVADAMIAFDLASRDGGPRLIDHHELLPFMPENTRASRDPFRCRITVSRRGINERLTIGVVPDRLFSVAYTDNRRHNYALELDRATTDIHSKTLIGKSSFRRKLTGYFYVWQAHRHTETWGFQSFRVLTITPSDKRLENMLAVLREVTDGAAPGLFLFTTSERFATSGPFSGWFNGAGEPTSLLPSGFVP
jgi:hypothetical protein